MATNEKKRTLNDFFSGQSKKLKQTLPSDAKIQILRDMGFDGALAHKALLENDDDMEKATEWCINHPSDEQVESQHQSTEESLPSSLKLVQDSLLVSGVQLDTVRSQDNSVIQEYTYHSAYPFPISCFGTGLQEAISHIPYKSGKIIKDRPDLDLVYYQPYMPAQLANKFFTFLRDQLPFYRVEYDIKRGGISAHIKTPRYTTVFGIDETSLFSQTGSIIDAKTNVPVNTSKDKHYSRYAPRPIPKCLDDLRLSTEAATGHRYNFCLVNYYASGADSISYHSDDERFLGDSPAIASFSLGARRDFLMKHKPRKKQPESDESTELSTNVVFADDSKPYKLPLGSGDMILMQGNTQANWLHSIPKRSGKGTEGGRINITFRRALIRAGTENYYNYNVGAGPVFGWDARAREMKTLSTQQIEAKNMLAKKTE